MIKTLILVIILLALFYFLTHIETFTTLIENKIINFSEDPSENKIQKIINNLLSLDNDTFPKLLDTIFDNKTNNILNSSLNLFELIKFIIKSYSLGGNKEVSPYTTAIDNDFAEIDGIKKNPVALGGDANIILNNIKTNFIKLFNTLKDQIEDEGQTLKIDGAKCETLVKIMNEFLIGNSSFNDLLDGSIICPPQSSTQSNTQSTTQATSNNLTCDSDSEIPINELEDGKTFRAVDDDGGYIYILSFKGKQIRYIKQLHSSPDDGGIKTIVDVLNIYSLMDNSINSINIENWPSNDYNLCTEKLPSKITFQDTSLKKDDTFTILLGSVNKSLTISGMCNYNNYPITPGHTQILPDGCLLAPTTTSLAPTTTSLAPTTTSLAPTTSSLAPTTTSLAPTTSSMRPTTTSLAPTTSTFLPSTSTTTLSPTTITTSSTPLNERKIILDNITQNIGIHIKYNNNLSFSKNNNSNERLKKELFDLEWEWELYLSEDDSENDINIFSGNDINIFSNNNSSYPLINNEQIIGYFTTNNQIVLNGDIDIIIRNSTNGNIISSQLYLDGDNIHVKLSPQTTTSMRPTTTSNRLTTTSMRPTTPSNAGKLSIKSLNSDINLNGYIINFDTVPEKIFYFVRDMNHSNLEALLKKELQIESATFIIQELIDPDNVNNIGWLTGMNRIMWNTMKDMIISTFDTTNTITWDVAIIEAKKIINKKIIIGPQQYTALEADEIKYDLPKDIGGLIITPGQFANIVVSDSNSRVISSDTSLLFYFEPKNSITDITNKLQSTTPSGAKDSLQLILE